MKKITAVMLCLMCVLSLSACGEKTEYADSTVTEAEIYPNVSMEIFDEEVRLDLVTLKVVNNNSFDIECDSVNDFLVEEFREGKWQGIKTGENSSPGKAAVIHGEQLLQIDVSAVYGKLNAGHYRIVKSFRTKKPDGVDTFCLTAEFDIK